MSVIAVRSPGCRTRQRMLLLCLTLFGLMLGSVAVPLQGTQAVSPGNPGFMRTWQRPDQPVSEGLASRTWLWGPEAFSDARIEPYADAPGGQRTVQYFDKSRMEDNAYRASTPWDVTNGLLVVELITGRMQLGDDSFEARDPAEVNVAGDADDPTGPTYRALGAALDAPAREAGEAVIERIDRRGQVSADPSLAARDITASHYVPETGHTVAGPFWTFMNSSGLVYHDGQYLTDTLFPNPFYATGYPLIEAYWAEVKVGGTYKDVLLQCFERRCLTYTPDNPEGWQVEAGNVGRHYYQWRYGQEPGGDPMPSPNPSPTPDPSPTPGPSPSPAPSPTPDPEPGKLDEYDFVDVWDTQVIGDPAIKSPVGIAVDPRSGDVYVVESGENGVLRFNADGALRGSWGSHGDGPGQFKSPTGVAVDAAGNVYVADPLNGRVEAFSPAGDFLGHVFWYGVPTGIADLAIDPDQEWVYALDSLDCHIERYPIAGIGLASELLGVAPDLTIGSSGSAEGQFLSPLGIGIDANGKLYVADTNNYRVQVYASTGEWLASFGSWGGGAGQFLQPRDVAASPDGRWIYVLDGTTQHGDAIQVWEHTAQGYAYRDKWLVGGAQPGQYQYAARIALDADGYVYVTEQQHGRIYKFTPAGERYDAWTDGSRGAFGHPSAVQTGSDARLYVVDALLKQVKVFSQFGEYTVQWGYQLQQPIDVAVVGGYAYVTDATRDDIVMFSADGVKVGDFGAPGSAPGQFNDPLGIAFDSAAALYVADSGNYRIQKLNGEGGFVMAWGSQGTGPGQFLNPIRVTVHGDTVYVADAARHDIQRFDLDGNYLGAFGGQGTAPGQFGGMGGLAVDAEGYVYATDPTYHRIQKFTATGDFVAELTTESTGMPAVSAPTDVAVGPNGQLYVVSSALEGVMVFEPVRQPLPPS